MNRRDFMTVVGGAGAASILGSSSLLASSEKTTPLYVRGLVMLSFSDDNYLRIALPKAHAHKATLTIVPNEGDRRYTEIKGHGALEGVRPDGTKPEVRLPELLHIREIYRDAVPRLEDSQSTISVPWSAVRSITTNTVSKDRWTFIRTDTGEEVHSVRPRKIAESIKIELLSSSTLKLNNGKVSVALGEVEELWTDFVPVGDKVGDFVDHFAHYLPYVETGNAFPVLPKRLGRARRQTKAPAVGNSFAMAFPSPICFLIRLD